MNKSHPFPRLDTRLAVVTPEVLASNRMACSPGCQHTHKLEGCRLFHVLTPKGMRCAPCKRLFEAIPEGAR